MARICGGWGMDGGLVPLRVRILRRRRIHPPVIRAKYLGGTRLLVCRTYQLWRQFASMGLSAGRCSCLVQKLDCDRKVSKRAWKLCRALDGSPCGFETCTQECRCFAIRGCCGVVDR